MGLSEMSACINSLTNVKFATACPQLAGIDCLQLCRVWVANADGAHEGGEAGRQRVAAHCGGRVHAGNNLDAVQTCTGHKSSR